MHQFGYCASPVGARLTPTAADHAIVCAHRRRPGQRITQIRNFVWLMAGIYQSRSVCLSRVAGKIPTLRKLLSTTRRLSRLLNNPAIRGRDWYEPIARWWPKAQFRNLGEARLIMDGAKIGFGHQLFIVYLAYRKRSRLSNSHRVPSERSEVWLVWG